MLGTIWLAWRAPVRPRAGARWRVLTPYAWSMLSMLTTTGRQHAARFPVTADADRVAFAQGFSASSISRGPLPPGSPRASSPVAVAVGLVGAIGFSQDIPHVLRPDITVAYTDTNGDGQRGDRRPPARRSTTRRSTPRSARPPVNRVTKPW